MFTPAKRSRAQKHVLPQAPSKNLRAAGGGAKAGGAGGRNRFSALLVEEDAAPVAVATLVKPVVSLAIEDVGQWGDEDEHVLHPSVVRWTKEVESTYWIHKPIVYQAPAPVEEEEEEKEKEKEWFDQEEELWMQPFTAALEMMNEAQDVYDCRRLSDSDYAAFMTFLYEKGWDVRHEERRFVQALTASEPSRVWVPLGQKCIPRFCREGIECGAQDCCYVHGDTIPKVKEECTFGAKCGASDPTGAKRALCIRMHPGEVWSPSACVHRQ
jgi:hypothetical protein